MAIVLLPIPTTLALTFGRLQNPAADSHPKSAGPGTSPQARPVYRSPVEKCACSVARIIMKAIQISRTGGPEVLDYVEVPTPTPGQGEVLVKADAIGVNYFDTMIRTGRYRWMPKLPFVPGNEMSGHIEALGPGVTALKTGQKVFVAGYEIENRGGLYAEYAAVPETAAWPLPASLGADEATALTNYQLAIILLHHAARGITAKTVVVYGAAGGAGSALIDVARLAGATVIGTAGGAEKCAFVRERGAAHAIDYARENVVGRVLALTGGRGADLLVD